MEKVIRGAQFTGGMPRQCDAHFINGNTTAIIVDFDQAFPRPFHPYTDACGTSIQCVFHQFFNDRSRPFDNLAGRDLGCHFIREYTNAHISLPGMIIINLPVCRSTILPGR